jgi:hypothetical protein
MSLSRIVKLGNWNEIVLGRDISNQLEDDVVYSVQNVLGVIIITPIGKSARDMAVKDQYPNWDGRDLRKAGQVLQDGNTFITEEEYIACKKAKS